MDSNEFRQQCIWIACHIAFTRRKRHLINKGRFTPGSEAHFWRNARGYVAGVLLPHLRRAELHIGKPGKEWTPPARETAYQIVLSGLLDELRGVFRKLGRPPKKRGRGLINSAMGKQPKRFRGRPSKVGLGWDAMFLSRVTAKKREIAVAKNRPSFDRMGKAHSIGDSLLRLTAPEMMFVPQMVNVTDKEAIELINRELGFPPLHITQLRRLQRRLSSVRRHSPMSRKSGG